MENRIKTCSWMGLVVKERGERKGEGVMRWRGKETVEKGIRTYGGKVKRGE